MQFINAVLGLSAIAVASASYPSASSTASSVLKVKVGESGLTYTPNNIIAEVGTQIEFEFFPKNHTVTQSSFADPCHPLAAGGFFSGFQPTKAGTQGNTFTVTVKDTKPIWFYCSQTTGNHCQAGMVGAINAKPSGNATLEAFIELAKKASTSTAPQGGVAGGELKVASGNSTAPAGPTAPMGTSYPTSTPPAATPTTLATPTPSGTFPGPSSSPTPIETGAATSISANVFALAAVLAGAVAML